MNRFVISDLHLGHKSILLFSPNRGGSTPEEHDEWIIQQYNSVVTKRDQVYILGDVAFGQEALKKVSRLRGQKYLIRGNHDKQSTKTYLEYFQQVYGLIKKYGFWMSHAPVHPQELRGRYNIHGHVHNNTITDGYYINACVDVNNGIPLNIEDLQKKYNVNEKEKTF